MTIDREVIERAARSSDPSGSIRDLKRIAAEALGNADPDANVVTLPNFNHTYLPDFVLEWPKQSSRDHRFVYLRSSSYLDELEEDVASLSDKEPVFLHLSDLEPAARVEGVASPAVQSLDSVAARSHSLVSSITAIGQFRAVGSDRQTSRLVSSYVVRGGQGLIEEETALQSAEVIEVGFQGALEADRGSTLRALETVERLLNPASATQFSHLLEAAWVSSGAPAMEFPGGITSIGEKLSTALLEELIRMVSAESEEFWTRVGSSVDLDSFSGLHLVGNQPALQLLIPHALKNLNSRHCAIRRTVRSDQEHDPFLWQIDDGILSLRGAGFQSWLASTPPASDEDFNIEEPPSINRLVSRCKNVDLPLLQIESVNPQGKLSYSSRDDSDLAVDAALGEIGRLLGMAAPVSSAVVGLRGKRLSLKFEDGVATGRTNANFPVRDLIIAVWSVMADMSSEERQEFLEKLPTWVEDYQ